MNNKLKGDKCMFEKLKKEIEFAKTSIMTNRNLYQVYGGIKMAHELKAISDEEYFKLNHDCVKDGINNPKYFD